MRTDGVVALFRAGARSAAGTISYVLVAAALVLASSSCRYVTTSIGDIEASPGAYLGREVTVSGNVSDSVKLPFLPGLYGIHDGSGELKVLTNTQPPLAGSGVRVRVRVETAAILGGQPIGLHLVELRRY